MNNKTLEINYKLLPAQSACYKMQRKHKAFIGGIGSGKTWFGGLWAAQQTILPGDGMVLAPTYRMLEDVTQLEYFSFLRDMRVPFQHEVSRGRIKTPIGYVYLRSADSADRLRGPNLTWAWGDEAALWGEDSFKVLLGRLRINDARSLLTTTPAGFNWLWEYFENRKNENYGYVRGSSKENTYLDAQFVSDLQRDYSTEYADQEIEGKFVAFEGLIYPEFDRMVHVHEFDVPKTWRRVRAVDYGYTNPFVCLWAAIDGDGAIYIYHEHYQPGQLIRDHAATIKAYEVAKYDWTVADWDAQDNAEMADSGIGTVRAQKDVSTGIQKVKARFAINADNHIRLHIHPSCVNLIKELGIYRWAPATPGGNAKEVPVKEADHALDALRYLVMEVDRGGFILA